MISRLLADWERESPLPRIVTIRTKTYPKMLKKSRVTGLPCPHQGVHRIATRNGILGCTYEGSVNRQRLRESQPLNNDGELLYFTPLELWNGKGEHDTRYTVRHRDSGHRYIVFKPTQKRNGELVITQDEWRDEAGTLLNSADLEEWLPLPSTSRRQEVNRPVAWRTIELDNVLSITYAGDEYALAA